MRRRNKPAGAAPSYVRIIAGRWRGRRLPVTDAAGLRPTKDSIRETLFNWLQPVIEGAHCLDAFAGSGALGFEAASRGAGEVVMLENVPRVHSTLQAQAQKLQADNVRIHCMSAEAYLGGAVSAPFDVVFLDPPFDTSSLAAGCERLATGGWLKPDARVYLETARQSGRPELPAGWRWVREKAAGDVIYGLAAAGE